MRNAWEKGQNLFQEALVRVTDNPEEMEYLSMIDFAVGCYAYVSAMNAYPDNRSLQNWTVSGYMVAWQNHFLTEEDIV